MNSKEIREQEKYLYSLGTLTDEQKAKLVVNIIIDLMQMNTLIF